MNWGGSGSLRARRMAACSGRVAVRCRKVPAGPVKVPRCMRSSSWRRLRQVSPVVVSAMRMSSRASQHSSDVGADAVFEAVVDGAQVEDGLHVPPAAFDFEELLVAQGDVLGGQGGVGAAQQVLAVEARSAADRGLVDAQQPAGGDAQEPVAGRGCRGDRRRARPRSVVGEAGRCRRWRRRAGRAAGRGRAVALGLFGVVADRRTGRAWCRRR